MKTVKLLKEMSLAEIRLLPKRVATLRKTVYKKSGNTDFSVTVEIAADFNYQFRIGEAMYGSIKLANNIKHDNQQVGCYLRLSKGENPLTNNDYYFLEVVMGEGLVLRDLLKADRSRQIELLVKQGAWPNDIAIGNYPAKVEELHTLILGDEADTK